MQIPSVVLLLFPFIFVFLLPSTNGCQLNPLNAENLNYSIKVHKSGNGHYTKIQEAIDSIPNGNSGWIRILISPDIYREKVTIPSEKTCIFLHGSRKGRRRTTIVWGDHQQTDSSATFTSFANYVVVKDITFKNSYNIQSSHTYFKVKPALAARIYGDMSAFYGCGFIGVQDTLWDVMGRHYFKGCYIEGAVDFIFGNGRSIFEKCVIYVNVGKYFPKHVKGYITAHRRMSQMEETGFVFKSCHFTGIGRALLGRAWGPYARVIISNSVLSKVVLPRGWDSWMYPHDKSHLSYVELNNRGPGSDTSRRASWVKKYNAHGVSKFLSMSFIDEDRWMAGLPKI